MTLLRLSPGYLKRSLIGRFASIILWTERCCILNILLAAESCPQANHAAPFEHRQFRPAFEVVLHHLAGCLDSNIYDRLHRVINYYEMRSFMVFEPLRPAAHK